MLNIILSIDYEIFGNGSGDPIKHIIKPADRLLNITKKYNIPLTIMFEVFEYIAYEKFNDQFVKDYGYSPVEEIKNQIKKAYGDGNDVQLHIHPQFIEMNYVKGKFLLKDSSKSINDFSNEEVTKIIDEAKNKLISLLNDSRYRCVAIRFSNMQWIEAPINTLSPLEKCGITFHSLYSYTPKSDKGYWKIDDSSIYEIPIFTVQKNYYKLFSLWRMFSIFYLWLYSPPSFFKKQNHDSEKMQNEKGKLFLKWDISKLSYKEMMSFLEFAIKTYNHENYEIPLVMIGHTKDFFNDKNFEKFLKISKEKYENDHILRFTTFADFKNIISDNHDN